MTVEQQILDEQGYIILATNRPEEMPVGKSMSGVITTHDGTDKECMIFVLRPATEEEWLEQVSRWDREGLTAAQAWTVDPRMKYFAVTAE